MTKAEMIEAEFDEPFDEVIRGFAEMGYSRRAVAEILEINLSYLRLLLRRRGLNDLFLPQSEMRRECRSSGGTGWPKGVKRNRPPRYSDGDLLSEVRQYPNSTTFTALADININTVIRRFGTFRRARELAYYGR